MIAVEAKRIIVIDDNPSIHDDFRKVLCRSQEFGLEANPFLGTSAPKHQVNFHLDSAYQGEEGLSAINEARVSGNPYSVAFVDIRMPPGWDGVFTAEKILAEDPNIFIVLCTAYSDHSTDEFIDRFELSERIMLLKKPFEVPEVTLLANSLSKRWLQCVQATSEEESYSSDQPDNSEQFIAIDKLPTGWDAPDSSEDSSDVACATAVAQNTLARPTSKTQTPTRATPHTVLAGDAELARHVDLSVADDENVTGRSTAATIATRLRQEERRLADQELEPLALIDELRLRLQEMLKSESMDLHAFALEVEARDPVMRDQTRRLQALAQELAIVLSEKGIYAREISQDFLLEFQSAISLYDIGKACIPDSILLKPGKFSDEEFDAMKQHTQVGARILEGLRDQGVPDLDMAIEIARYHHEYYDGAGYPEGLEGRSIPLAARIATVADAVNAITSNRIYKHASSVDYACRILNTCRGGQFDPIIVDAFLANLKRILRG